MTTPVFDYLSPEEIWKRNLIASYDESCPKRYAETDSSRLNPEPFKEALSWDHGQGDNLLLLGPTGRGKTRTAWLIVKNLMLEKQIKVCSVNDAEFVLEVGDKTMSGKLKDYVAGLCKPPVLFIDDLGKAIPTERYIASLYYLVEERHSHQKPVIVTSQLSEQELNKRFSSRDIPVSHAAAIVRRLKENCKVIKF